MICIKIGDLEIARGGTEEELLNQPVYVFEGVAKPVPLGTVINNDPEYISEEIFNNINEFLNRPVTIDNKKKILANKELYPALFIAQVDSTQLIQTEFKELRIVESDDTIDEIIVNDIELPVQNKSTSDKKNYTSIAPFGIETRTAKDSRRTDEELAENPMIQFINRLFNNPSEDTSFKAFSGKELYALLNQEGNTMHDYMWKKSTDVKGSIPTLTGEAKEKAIKFVADNWDYSRFENDEGINLVLVDSKGNIKTTNLNGVNYIVRFGLDNFSPMKDKPIDKGKIYTLVGTDKSKGKPVLHPYGSYEKFDRNFLVELKNQNQLRIQVLFGIGGKNIKGKPYPGNLFFYSNDRQFHVQIDFPPILKTDYVNIISRIGEIQKMLAEQLASGEISKDKYDTTHARIALAWNRLVKHDKQTKDVEDGLEFKRTPFYQDFMYPLKDGKKVEHAGKVHTEGFFIHVSKLDVSNRKIFIDGETILLIEDGKFKKITKEQAAEEIYNFSNAELQGGQRRFSPPLESRAEDRGASDVSLDDSSYVDILGIKELSEGLEISPVDMVAKLGRSRVKFQDGKPLIFNAKFEVTEKVVNAQNVPDEVLAVVDINKVQEELEAQKVEEVIDTPTEQPVEVKVDKTKLRAPKGKGKVNSSLLSGDNRSIDLEQLGRRINQKDIDNLKKIFPSLESRELRLLAATAQTDYWGRVTRKAFILREDSTIGTLYHEAWHEFSQWYLPKTTKDELYKKVQQLTGIKDRKLQEEFLAEEFAKYRLGLPINPKLQSYFLRKGNIFQRILDFIKSLFSNESNILREFNRLGLVIEGKKKLKYFSETNLEFEKLNKAVEKQVTETDSDGNPILNEDGKPIVKTEMLFTNTQMINVVHLIDSMVYTEIENTFKYDEKNEGKTYYTANSGFSPDYITSENIKNNQFKGLRDALKERISEQNEFFQEVEDDDRTFYYNTLHENFDLVFNEYIKQTQLPIKNVSGLKLDDDGNIIEEENIEGTRNKGNFLEGNETTILMDMDKSLKAIINSLRVPTRSFTKEEYDAAKEDEDLEFELYQEVKIGDYFQRVNLSTTVTKIFSLLEGINSYEGMIEKLQEKAIDNPEFWELLDKLPTINEVSQGSYKARDIATKFEANKRYYLAFYNTIVNLTTKKEKSSNFDVYNPITGEYYSDVEKTPKVSVKVDTSVTEAERNNLDTIKASNANDFQTEKRTIVYKGTEYSSLDDLYNSGFKLETSLENLDIVGKGMKSVKFTNEVPLIKMLTLLEMAGISLSKATVEHLGVTNSDRSALFDKVKNIFLAKAFGIKKINNLITLYQTTLEENKDKIEETPDKFIKIGENSVRFKDIETKLNNLKIDVPFKRFFSSVGLGLDVEYEALNNLLNLESRFNTTQYTTVVKNANGDLVNTLFMYNGLAQMLTAINDTRYNTIKDIVDAYPYMKSLLNYNSHNNRYSGRTLMTDNQYLKAIFNLDGTRRLKDGVPLKITWNNMGGHVTKVDGRAIDEDNSTKLTEIDKMVQNMVMDSSVQRLTRPGDKSTETGFIVPGMSGVVMNDARTQIMSYVLNEVSFAYKTFGYDKFLLREFDYLQDTIKKYLKPGMSEEEFETVLEQIDKDNNIWKEVKDYIKDDISDYKRRLIEFELTANNLANNLLKSNNKLEDLDILLEKFIVKKYLNSIAQGNLFYGYTGMYADKFKRNSHIYSTGTMLSTSKSVLTGINAMKKFSYAYVRELRKDTEFNKQYEKILKSDLSNEDKKTSLEELISKNTREDLNKKYEIDINTPTYKVDYIEKKDYIKPSKQAEAIKNSFDESNKYLDGKSITNFDNSSISNYEKNNAADAQVWCSFDFYKTFKELIGKWSPEQEYLHSMLALGIEVREYKGKPIETFFPPVKPQYAGYTPTGNAFHQDHAFDKMSFLPFIPFVYEGTEFENVGNELAEKNIAYRLTRDAAKVGNSTERYFAFLKEQVNIEAHDHHTSVFPTQLRQIISGFAKDKNGNWLPGFEDLVNRYSDYSKQLSEQLKLDLIKELGYVEGGEVDKNKLKELLDKELVSRDFPTPIIDAVEIIDGQFKYDLESVLAKQTVTNLITSIVNRRLVRLQVNGDMLVQISSHYVTKEALLFYKLGTINGVRQTLPSTVQIGLRGQWAKLLKFKDQQGNTIETRERLNELLRGIRKKLIEASEKDTFFTDWELMFMKATQMTGVRIPTQGINSMEVFQIEEFLDDKVGGLIVVPEEITTKAGSDFDIDKLVLMYPETDDFGGFINNSAEHYKRVKESLAGEIRNYKEAKAQSYKEFKATQRKLKQELSEANYANFKLYVQNYKNNIDDLKIQLNEIFTEQTILKEDVLDLEDRLVLANSSEKQDLYNRINNIKAQRVSNYDRISNIQQDITDSYNFINDVYKNNKKNLSSIWNPFISSFEEIGKFNSQLTELLESELEESKFEYLIQSYDFKDVYSELLAESRNVAKLAKNKKLFIHNNLQSTIKDLITHPLRYTELVYPNNTDIIGAVGKLDDAKLDFNIKEQKDERLSILNSSVNKLEIKRYLEMYKQGKFKDKNKVETDGKLDVLKFLKEVQKRRDAELNAAYGKSNTQKAEDAKFINGLVWKGLVGVAALQVTMINLISNYNIGIKIDFQIDPTSETQYRIPVCYFSEQYKKDNIKDGILEFTTNTDTFIVKEYDENLQEKTKKTSSYLKRTLAEQMVNPAVDSLNDKNPISQININTETLSTVSFMTTYLGITSEIAYYLVNQPLILEHIKNKQVNNSKFSNEIKSIYGKDKKPTGFGLIREILKTHARLDDKQINAAIKELRLGRYAKISEKDVTNMFNDIGKGRNDMSINGLQQLQHLANYAIFEELSEEYRQLQSATNWSTNTQNSYFASQEKLRELDEVKTKGIFTNIDRLAEESVVSNFKVQKFTSEILQGLFDLTTADEFTRVALFFGKKLKSDTRGTFYRTLSNDFYKFILDNYLEFEPDLAKELFTNANYSPTKTINTGVIDALKKLKENPRFKDNLFVQNAFAVEDGITKNLEVKVATREVDSSDAITEGIADLIDYEENNVLPEKRIGKKLVFLGLLQDGLNKSNISWSQYISPELYSEEVKKALNKYRKLSDKAKNNQLLNFITLFFQNNPNILKGATEENVKVEVGYNETEMQRVNSIKRFFGLAGFEIKEPRVAAYKFKNYKLASPLNAQLSKLDKEGIKAILEKFKYREKETSDRKTYRGVITELADNQVYVFGSNPIGVNGNIANGTGGAALVAQKNGWVKPDEKMINKLSENGKSYGIVTVIAPGKKKSVSKYQLSANVRTFYELARQNPDKEYLVAYSGKNPAYMNLNGYSSEEMASMFAQDGLPDNVIFEENMAVLVDKALAVKNYNKIQAEQLSKTTSVDIKYPNLIKFEEIDKDVRKQLRDFAINIIEPRIIELKNKGYQQKLNDEAIRVNKLQNQGVTAKSNYTGEDMFKEMFAKEPEYVKLFNLNSLLLAIYEYGLQYQDDKLINMMNNKIQDSYELLNEYLPYIFNNTNIRKSTTTNQKGNLLEYITTSKNVLNITPIQAADEKAVSKAKIANKYIGYADGIANSSTASYAQQAGDKANLQSYNENDVVFVSVGGKRGEEVNRHKQQDKTIVLAKKALLEGATLLTDNKAYTDSNSYNEGEKKLKIELEKIAFYTEVVIDGNKIGVWSTKDFSKESLTSTTQPNQPTQVINFQEEPTTGYKQRTINNAKADATIHLGVDFTTAGERLTKSSVESQNKKYIPVDTKILVVTKSLVNSIVEQLNSVNAKTLNIAGNGIYSMPQYTQQQVDDFTFNLLNKVLNSPNLTTKIESIRSGGQTGFDEAGAKAGIKLGLPTIVLAPNGWVFRDKNSKDISDEAKFKERFKVESPLVTTQPTTTISEFGNKTKSENVVLPTDYGKADKDFFSALSEFKKQYPNGILAYRVNKNKSLLENLKEQNAIGNPFDWQKYGVGEATNMFKDWILENKNFGEPLATDEYRNAVIAKIRNSKNEKILYYTELNKPSHATVLDYLINKYNWNNSTPTTTNNKYDINQQTSSKSDDIKFNSSSTEYNWLSNFEKLENPIIDDKGRKYWTVEAFYQSKKANSKAFRNMLADETITGAQAKRGGQAKYFKDNNLTLDPNFEASKYNVMKEAIRQKFENNPKLKAKLLATKSDLVEWNSWGDKTWGITDNDNKGNNALGKIIMEYRDSQVVTEKPIQSQNDRVDIEAYYAKAEEQLTKSINSIFKGKTTVTINEALTNLIESGHPSSNLAKHLLKFKLNTPITLKDNLVDNKGNKVGGLTYKDRIELNTDIVEGTRTFQSNLLHEVLHIATQDKLLLDIDANKRFTKVYEEAKKHLPNEYATTNIDEFITGIYTDVNFVKKIKNLKAIDVTYKSLYDELVNVILNFLGLKKGESLYEQAINIGFEVMDLEETEITPKTNPTILSDSKFEYMLNSYSEYSEFTYLDIPLTWTEAEVEILDHEIFDKKNKKFKDLYVKSLNSYVDYLKAKQISEKYKYSTINHETDGESALQDYINHVENEATRVFSEDGNLELEFGSLDILIKDFLKMSENDEMYDKIKERIVELGLTDKINYNPNQLNLFDLDSLLNNGGSSTEKKC